MLTVPAAPNLPHPQLELMRTVFDQVLRSGEPVPVSALSAAIGRDQHAVRADLAALAASGHVRLTPDGKATDAFGITAEQTCHQVVIDGRPRNTWCAVDALGILGALEATGEVRSRSPRTGQAIRIEFRDGEPQGGDLNCVVFVAHYRAGSPTVDRWCPLVNFFADAGEAAAWAAERGADGECSPLAEAAALAKQHWRDRLTGGGAAAAGE